jgi:hypothetical protein
MKPLHYSTVSTGLNDLDYPPVVTLAATKENMLANGLSVIGGGSSLRMNRQGSGSGRQSYGRIRRTMAMSERSIVAALETHREDAVAVLSSNVWRGKGRHRERTHH